MIKNNLVLKSGVFCIVFILFASCYKTEKQYGKEISNNEIVTIENILKNSDKHNNKTVKIKGKIVSECTTGCWFYINSENNNSIRVDLAPNGFAIPQLTGKKVIVEGAVKVQDNNTEIIGTGVKIQ